MAEVNQSPDATRETGPEYGSPEYQAKRRAAIALAEGTAWRGVDDTDPKGRSGHARGIRISSAITSNYRQTHRKNAMDITPQEVIDVLVNAGVTKWVLMGLHGYVGYLPDPRATQDVDILIPHSQKKKAVKAIMETWPSLVVQQLEAVIRFKDPADLDAEGRPKPVIDLMLPWNKLNEAVLRDDEHTVIDTETKHVIATVEVALASKYAAMISDFRSWEKKQQDAVDFRRIARTNRDHVDRDYLRRLGELVWSDGGGIELEKFFDVAQQDKPFPI